MKFFKDIINEISKNEINTYYNIENHSWKECMEHWQLSSSSFARLLKYYEIKKDIPSHNKLIAETKLKRYGTEKYNNRNKAKQTCLEKYGVENPFQDTENIKQAYLEKLGVDHPMHDEIIKQKVISKLNYEQLHQKAQQTYLARTGYLNPANNPECIKKGLTTKTKNGCFTSDHSSNLERRLEKILIRKFEEHNVVHHYRDPRYARNSGYQFECDFYIKSLDLFIELNAAYYHHLCPFNEKLKEHIELSNKLKQSSKKWEVAKFNTWVCRDVEKQKIAQQNNLNYLQLYPSNTIYNNQQFNDKKYSKLISYLLKKLNTK